MGSEELCERLIREAGVACVPGTCFGAEGFMRLSYCVGEADLKLGLDRIEAFLARLWGEGASGQPRFRIPTDGSFATGSV